MEAEGFLCPMCDKNMIRSTDERIDCCIDCQNTGRNFEFYLSNPVRNNLLSRIREMEHVNTANLWRVSSANFVLGIILEDGRMLTAGAANEDDDSVFPGIPAQDGGWGVTMMSPQVAPYEWVDMPELLGVGYGDDELVEKISELAEV